MAFHFPGESSKEREPERREWLLDLHMGWSHLEGKGAISHLCAPSFSSSGKKEAQEDFPSVAIIC